MSDGLRGTIFTALTGVPADVSGQPGGDLLGALRAVGGPSTATRSGIDLTRAAGRLGVTRRTVERWVQAVQTGAGMRPSPARARQLARLARQAATTRAGRRAALARSTVRQAIVSRGARVSIRALQGPRAAGRDYPRPRTTQLDLDPADAQRMVDAWEQGGDRGFMRWATEHWGREYVPDWQFSQVDSIDVEQPFGGRWR